MTPASRIKWDETAAGAIIAERRHLAGATLPILHALQERFGYVDAAAVPLIADALNLSRAEVHGVISYYHDFRSAPPGRHTVKLCRAEACQAMGGRALQAHAERRLKTACGGTSADGLYSLEAVYCLGNCAAAPNAVIDGKPYARLSPERLDALIAGLGV